MEDNEWDFNHFDQGIISIPALQWWGRSTGLRAKTRDTDAEQSRTDRDGPWRLWAVPFQWIAAGARWSGCLATLGTERFLPQTHLASCGLNWQSGRGMDVERRQKA